MKTSTPESAPRKATLAIPVALTLILAAAPACAASPKQQNATGLPTYPHDGGGTMDSVVRSIPNGQGQDPSTSIEIFKCTDAAPSKHDD